VTGPLNVKVYLSTDAVDTDLWARVLDVGPDGKAESLMYPGLDVLRASYRDNAARKLLKPGEVYLLEFSHMVTSNVFKKGHRVRVQLSTSLHPHYSRNLHTGESELFSKKMKKARIRIYHDKEHPSSITLPVIPAGK
jgi:putative CocE/NonD family hydrolase